MNDSEPLHLGAPALKHCLPLSLFFHIWNFRNLQQLRFLVSENHLKILEKITHNFWKNNLTPKVKTGDSFEKLLLIN